MDQREFINTIQTFRIRLNLAGYLKKMVLTLRIGVVIGILFQLAAFVTPLYYVDTYVGIALLFIVVTTSVTAYVKRTGMEQTALVMDSFGFDERIVTAYENIKKENLKQENEGALVALQRADAMRQLQMHQDKIQISLLPPWKKTASLIGLFAVMIVLSMVPSKTKEQAEVIHSIKEEAQEKTDEIEEIVETLEQLAQEESLTPEQQAQLQEMIESLQASREEYQQAVSSEMMKAASQKLEYRYEYMSSQLAGLAQSLKDGAAVSSVTADSLQAMSEKLQEMSGMQLAQSIGSQSGQQGGSQNGNGQNGQQGGSQNGNGQNGQQGGSQNGNSQNGQQGGSQSGDQNGNSQNGNGQSGSGNGDGDGESGNGRGTGSSSAQHDYVSIPNDIADSGNLTGNAINHDASEYFHAQNGLSWEGTHMSHEAVIGSYTQNAYEGIAQGRYPSGMEEIIKEYFSSFN